MRGTPCGRHSADESSFSWMPVFRSSSSAWAHGWYGMLSTCRFAAKFAGLPSYVFSGLQIPDRSGLPFGNRGGGAERFGLPSGVRGILVGGSFALCDLRGVHNRTWKAIEVAIIVLIFIFLTLLLYMIVCN